MQKKRIFLGFNAETGNIVYTGEEQRSTHMQVVGATGGGKSKFLEHLIRCDIQAGNGLCLIDPHGRLYWDVLMWLAAIRWPEKKIILFNPSNDQYVTGFNPLKVSVKDLSYHVDAMVRACAKVWGGEDTDRTPLLKRCLRIIFHALAEQKLSLLEAQHLTSPHNKLAREVLTQEIKDPIIKEQWDYFLRMNERDFYAEMGSTINRLIEFLAAERVRKILGQLERGLDFEKIMDEGYVLLVNLSKSKSLSDDNARLLGSLIVNDLFVTATERKPNCRPFYLYIDECGLFINEDIARILDEGRKFGLHLILAHQHLAQLKKAGEEIYHSVMTDAKTKVVFGGLTPEDAEILAQQMFLGEIDLDEVKHVLDKPTVVGYTKIWLRNYSRGYSMGESESRGEGTSSGLTESATRVIQSWLSMGETSPDTVTTSRMYGYNSSYGRSSSYQESYQEGASEALEPELEIRPYATYTLEEQIFKAMRTLVNQAQRHAVVKLPGLFTKRIVVPTVKVYRTAGEGLARLYERRCNEISGFHKAVELVEKEIESRQRALVEKMYEYQQRSALELTKQRKEPEYYKERKVKDGGFKEKKAGINKS